MNNFNQYKRKKIVMWLAGFIAVVFVITGLAAAAVKNLKRDSFDKFNNSAAEAAPSFLNYTVTPASTVGQLVRRTLRVGDNLSGKTIYFDWSKYSTPRDEYKITFSGNGPSYIGTSFDYEGKANDVLVLDGIGYIFDPTNVRIKGEYVLPENIGKVLEVDNPDYFSYITADLPESDLALPKDKYIYRPLQIGDDLSGRKIFINHSEWSGAYTQIQPYKSPWIIFSGKDANNESYAMALHADVDGNAARTLFHSWDGCGYIFHPDNYTEVSDYLMPYNTGTVVSIDHPQFFGFITFYGLNPDYKPPALAVPKVTINETGVALWQNVGGATGYKYKINGGAEQWTEETSMQLKKADSITVMAISSSGDFADSKYSETLYYKLPVLTAPVISISSRGVASWTETEGADGYIYKLNGGAEQRTKETSLQLKAGDRIVIKAFSNHPNVSEGTYSKEYEYKGTDWVKDGADTVKDFFGTGKKLAARLSAVLGVVTLIVIAVAVKPKRKRRGKL